VGGGGLAGIHVVETALSHLLLGQDATEVEGLWQQMYRLAESYNVKVCPHRGCEVWSLHAIAALNADPLAESGRPWMTWVQGQPEIHQGDIQLGNTPGFGVTFDAQLWP
jgi:L-rhamnonate dehydratase